MRHISFSFSDTFDYLWKRFLKCNNWLFNGFFLQSDSVYMNQIVINHRMEQWDFVRLFDQTLHFLPSHFELLSNDMKHNLIVRRRNFKLHSYSND